MPAARLCPPAGLPLGPHRAEVGLLHARIRAHGFGQVEGDHLAIDEHGDLVGEAEHHAHVVLHRQQRLAHRHLADQVHEARRSRSAHAGGRLVEQDHARTAGDRDADFQRALLGVGEVRREHVAPPVELDHRQHFFGPLVRVAQVGQELPECVAVAQAPQHGAADVLEHRQPREQVAHLEAAREPAPVDLERCQAVDLAAVQQDVARGRAEAPADQVEERALACAVGADEGHALACRHGEAGTADDLGLPKLLRTSRSSRAKVKVPPRASSPPRSLRGPGPTRARTADARTRTGRRPSAAPTRRQPSCRARSNRVPRP